ncbi:MAG TPA: DUF3618 domain-containing protein [Solirubrobacteraceae bacterium]|nr:DUF3618 domain-containing protein [Solirubrobacteraceae bacterium]
MSDEQPTVPTEDTESRSAEDIRADIEQTREQLGETVEALAAKTDVKAQAHDRIGAAKETVAENIGAARESVSAKAGEFAARAREATPDSAGAGAQQMGETIQQRPLPFAVAGAFAAGLLIGWLLHRG